MLMLLSSEIGKLQLHLKERLIHLPELTTEEESKAEKREIIANGTEQQQQQLK